MAAIPIPKEVRAGVAKLLLLSDEANQELMTALERIPPSFGYQELGTNAATHVKSIDPESTEEIVQVLLSLYMIRSNARVPLPDFIEDFVEGIEQTDLKETLSQVSVEKFKEWLTRFLKLKTLGFTTKARAAQRDFDNAFCSGQITTDIRPLFESTNGESSAIAAVITHTLKISYHHGNTLRDLFIAVDSGDLETLENLIEQARTESEQLQALLDAAKIPYPKDEEE